MLVVAAASHSAGALASEHGYGSIDTSRMPRRGGELFPLPADFPGALEELELNVKEHDEEHRTVCRRFYCGDVEKLSTPMPTRIVGADRALGPPGRCNQQTLGAPSTDFCDEMEASAAPLRRLVGLHGPFRNLTFCFCFFKHLARGRSSLSPKSVVGVVQEMSK